jgi:hypothetical protein
MRESLLLAQWEFLVPLFSVLPPPDPSLLLARRSLLLPPLRRARSGSGRGRLDRMAFTATLLWEE